MATSQRETMKLVIDEEFHIKGRGLIFTVTGKDNPQLESMHPLDLKGKTIEVNDQRWEVKDVEYFVGMESKIAWGLIVTSLD